MRINFQSKGDFQNAEKWLKDVISRDPEVILKKIADDGVESLSSNTPRDTGETAAGWFSEIVKNGSMPEVIWKNKAHPNTNVNLAVLIDQGHGTGTGGYVAPVPYIKKSMDAVWDDAANKIAEEMVK